MLKRGSADGEICLSFLAVVVCISARCLFFAHSFEAHSMLVLLILRQSDAHPQAQEFQHSQKPHENKDGRAPVLFEFFFSFCVGPMREAQMAHRFFTLYRDLSSGASRVVCNLGVSVWVSLFEGRPK